MFLLSYLSVCLSSFPETQTGVSHRGKPYEGVMKEAPLKPSLLALFVCGGVTGRAAGVGERGWRCAGGLKLASNEWGKVIFAARRAVMSGVWEAAQRCGP